MACVWRMICHQIAPSIVLFKPVILLIYNSTTLNMLLCNNFALLHGTPILNRINIFTNLIHVCGVWSSYNGHLENSLRESFFFVILSTGGDTSSYSCMRNICMYSLSVSTQCYNVPSNNSGVALTGRTSSYQLVLVDMLVDVDLHRTWQGVRQSRQCTRVQLCTQLYTDMCIQLCTHSCTTAVVHEVEY